MLHMCHRYLLIPLGVHTSGRLNSSDVLYDPLPLHHTAGGVLGAGQCLVLGLTVVLRKKFSASNYWNDVAKYECTVILFVFNNSSHVQGTHLN